MMKIIATILLATTLMLGGCAGKVSVWNEEQGVLVEVPDGQSATMMYEFQLKSKQLEEKWKALASLDKDNIVAGMAIAFELGKNEKVTMTRFKTWDERLLPYVQLVLGFGGAGGNGFKNLFSESKNSGNNVTIWGDGNNFNGLDWVDSRDDTVWSGGLEESHETDLQTEMNYHSQNPVTTTTSGVQ